MNDNVWKALEIMGSGMLGIFAAIIIIMFFVWILQKTDQKKSEAAK